MKRSVLLTVTSLLSILLMTLHLADDYVRGLSTPGPDNVIGVAILLVWLYGTLMFPERRLGYIVMLLGALFASAMPILHMTGKSYPEIATSNGGFFFIWTVFTLGVIGWFSLILAARCIWNPEWGKSRGSD